jgi:hypothetical protein
LAINESYDEDAIIRAVADALENFYESLIANLDKLSIKKIMRQKNPYLIRAKSMQNANEIVDAYFPSLFRLRKRQSLATLFLNP